jgi:hypothetical protein
VAAEAVGQRLHQHRPAVLAGLADRVDHHVVGVDHVHPVAAHARHAEAVAAPVQIGLGGVALERGAHAELVVGDHEDHGQPPQRGEIERLAERALVGRAVAEHADGHLVAAEVVRGEAHARGERQVPADDPVAAHEAPLEVEHVHRAAAAVRDPVLAPEQLGHHAVGIGAPRQRVPVRAIGRDQVVLVAHRAHGADDRGLLADGQMQEPADLGLGVHLARALLEVADEHHGLQPLPRRVGVRKLAMGVGAGLGDVGHRQRHVSASAMPARCQRRRSSGQRPCRSKCRRAASSRSRSAALRFPSCMKALSSATSTAAPIRNTPAPASMSPPNTMSPTPTSTIAAGSPTRTASSTARFIATRTAASGT